MFKEQPIRASNRFVNLGNVWIIRNAAARKQAEKMTGYKYFSSFRDMTDFAAEYFEQDMKRLRRKR